MSQKLVLYLCLLLLILVVVVRSSNKRPHSFADKLREVLSRRATSVASLFLLSSPSLSIASTSTGASTTAAAAQVTSVQFSNLDESAEFIQKHCTKILQAARQSGKLLYRGEPSLKGLSAALISSDGDLLDVDTYNERKLDANDASPQAKFGSLVANYFESLDAAITSSPKPSTSHLATGSIMEASKWGPVASVWPVDALDFAYLKNEKTWWNDDYSTPQSSNRAPLFWRQEELLEKFLHDELKTNFCLDLALEAEKEIMFSSNVLAAAGNVDPKFYPLLLKARANRQLFVAVPILQTSKLLTLLDISPRDVTIRVGTSRRKTKDEELEESFEDIRSLRDKYMRL